MKFLISIPIAIRITFTLLFSCGSKKEKSYVESIVNSLEEELDGISSSGQFSNFLDFIQNYKDTILHRHHYLIMTATRNLIQYYTYRSPNEFLESKNDWK